MYRLEKKKRFVNTHLRRSVLQLTVSGLIGQNGARAQSRAVTEYSSAIARVTDRTTGVLTAMATSSSLETAILECVLVGNTVKSFQQKTQKCSLILYSIQLLFYIYISSCFTYLLNALLSSARLNTHL